MTLSPEPFCFLLPGSAGGRYARLREAFQKRRQCFTGISLDTQRYRIGAANVTAVDIDLHNACARLDIALVVIGGEIAQARADNQQEISPPAGCRGLGRAGTPERANVIGVRVRDSIVTAIRGDYGQRIMLTEA